MKNSHTLPQRRFVFSIIFLTVILVVCGVLFWWAMKARENFLAARVEMTKIGAQALRADALRTRWKSIEAEAVVIEEAFLDRNQLPKFFQSIETTAAAAGVKVEISIVKESPAEISFRIHAAGDFPGLFVFATHLNVLPTLLFVDEVSFLAAPEGASRSPASSTGTTPSVDVVIRVPLRGGATALKQEEASSIPAQKDGLENKEL